MPTPTISPHPSVRQTGGNGAKPGTSPARLAPVGRRRNPAALILAVLCIAGGALAGTIAYRASSGRISVLATARAVGAGHTLQAADLRVVDVSADAGLPLVPASEETAVIGRPAAVPLAPGAPLTRSDLGSPPTLPQGEAVVGVLCRGGQYPPSLAPGDRVEVIDAGIASVARSPGAVPPGSGEGLAGSVVATVVGIDAPPDVASAGTVVSLRLAASDAPSVARAAVAGRLALVLVAPGG